MRNEQIAASLGYRILEDGTPVGIRGIPLKGWFCKHGYHYFRVGNKGPSIATARIQAFQKYGLALYIPGTEARHKNGNQADNSCTNILIGTKLENEADKTPEARRRGIVAGSIARRKLTVDTCKELRAARKLGAKYSDLMQTYGISKSTVSYVVNRRTYSGVDD